MLVLSRKEDEVIKIGDFITITVVRIAGNRVRIGIEAPEDYVISRPEQPRKDGDQPRKTA